MDDPSQHFWTVFSVNCTTLVVFVLLLRSCSFADEAEDVQDDKISSAENIKWGKTVCESGLGKIKYGQTVYTLNHCAETAPVCWDSLFGPYTTDFTLLV